MAIEFDDKFQRRIVAMLLRHPDHAKRIAEMLDPAWIEGSVYADIADVAIAYVREFGKPPTKNVLRRECGDEVVQSPLFHRLYTVDLSDAAYLISHFSRFCKYRAVQRAIVDAAKLVKSGTVSPDIISKLQHAMIVGEDMSDIGMRLRETTEQRIAEYVKGTNYSSSLPTGWSHVDRLIHGVAPGELGIIMAPTNGGKSYGLMDMGYNLITRVAGHRVLHITCEMSERKTLARFDRRIAGVKALEAFKTAPREFGEILAYNMRQRVIGDLRVKGYPSKMATANKIMRFVDVLKTTENWAPDAIIVDYLDEMKADTRQREKRDELAEIARDLRRMAGMLRVPVWSATQTNRGSLDKQVITMADVAESFEKMHVADVVLAFCRTPEERVANKMRIFIAKARDARAGGMVSCNFDPAYGRIQTLSYSEEVALDKGTGRGLNKGKSIEDRMKESGRKKGAA